MIDLLRAAIQDGQIAPVPLQPGQVLNVISYFTNAGRMMPPVQRVNVDFAQDMLRELDLTARELNVSRQAVIKIFVRQALNQHYLAQRARHEKTSSKRA